MLLVTYYDTAAAAAAGGNMLARQHTELKMLQSKFEYHNHSVTAACAAATMLVHSAQAAVRPQAAMAQSCSSFCTAASTVCCCTAPALWLPTCC
jgi:hypothetical protein